jgi:hypothetical protein
MRTHANALEQPREHFWTRWFFRDHSYGRTFAPVNPWHAAMEDAIGELKHNRRRAPKRPQRKVERPEDRRPVLRM